MTRVGLVGLAGALMLQVAGCHRSPPPPVVGEGEWPNDVLAIVDGEVIRQTAFEEELARRARKFPGRFRTPVEREALLDELILFEAKYRRAKLEGYDRDPRVLAGWKRLVVSIFQEDRAATAAAPPPPSDSEVQRYYSEHPEQFGVPERRRAAIVWIPVSATASAEKRAAMAERAEAVRLEALREPAPDGSFGALAQRVSDHQASRYAGGDIGWFTAGEAAGSWDPALRRSLFGLGRVGEVSPVVTGQDGFYLCRLMDQQPAQLRDLAEVRAGIEYRLAREREAHTVAELEASWKAGLDIRVNRSRLEAITLPGDVREPPAVPGSRSSIGIKSS